MLSSRFSPKGREVRKTACGQSEYTKEKQKQYAAGKRIRFGRNMTSVWRSENALLYGVPAFRPVSHGRMAENERLGFRLLTDLFGTAGQKLAQPTGLSSHQ